ncbi:E3 ubiquitin-protein ligase huwe1-like [Plakobranchus ocellatus]|uniref:HECT-type E3 ubiquitin transferase n=1 Tax=Plakobranchus ocellatus TaxID=259542 RepID=A0AAV4DFD4_9GAST|nr:E3 ubiquitin-protein ligase huwe1-like [Plakobranchus ocellatus]
MKEVLKRLEPLHCPLESPGGSVLLRELANAAHIPDATLSPSATPLLHALSAAHAYITMFVHVCRMGQFEIRNISVNHWGSELGLSVLKGLSFLYNSLVWESTVLLALCNEDYLPSNCMFGKADLEKLLSKDTREKNEGAMEEEKGLDRGTNDNGGAVAMDTHPNTEERMDTSESSPADAATAAANGGAAFGITQMQNPPAAVTPSASSTSIDSELLHPAEGGSSGLGTSEVSGDDKESKRKLSPAMQAQLRQLKPLLTLSSRLGRALSELFVLLVKLCVGSPVRMRRSQQLHPPVMPSPAARQVALALTKLLAGGLSFQPPIDASLAKLRMTFLVCSVGFTAPMLFDEKKHPFHLMLQKFVACGGQAALFQSFSWALSMDGKVSLAQGLEHPDLTEGTGEFLDSWLALVEKMINTKAVLESPHVLPAKGKTPGLSPFNPVQYLISTQKAAFNAVMNLWNKKPLPVHGSRMSESVFTILCHIIKGEAIIKKHLEKEKAGVAGIAGPSGAEAVDLSGAGPSGLLSASGRGLLEPAVNQAHLQQLMDMGFSREQASVALSNTTSVEQATEYILSNPLPVSASSLAGIMDLNGDENDEDQITRAIAMSLGETFPSSSEQTKEQKAEKTDEDAEEKQEGEEPLDTAVLDNFTQNIFPGCLNLLDTLPETVYRVCDLLIVVMQRNGPDWQRETLGTLCKALCGLCEEMTNYAQDMNIDAMQNSASAQKFATRLHLLSLLAEEMNLSCSLAMQHVNLPGRMVSLLQACKDPMLVIGQTAGIKSTPRWLAPMLVLLDLWEKIAISLRRKMEARIAIGANRIWKWFDDSSGRWCKYSSNNNQTIDDAYRKGDSIVRFQAGRRKYSVQFGTMVQLNEETGNRRPVMLSIQTAEDKPNGKKEAKDTVADEQLIEEIRKEFEVPADTNDYLPCLPHESIEIIINCLSAFLSIPLNSDTLQAAMRLILRMTRQHQYAVLFVAQGGARQLLSLSLDSNFQGFLNLATLIFRHILEEPVALRYCMEKVMRNVCAGIGSCQSGVSQGGIGAQEMHYVLRVLGPAACRDPELFTEVARDTLQIALPSPQDEAEARYTGPNAPQILKCSPTKQLEALVNPSIKTFIWDLLNSLIAEQPVKSNKSIDQAASQTVAQVIEDAVSEVTAQIRSNISAFSVVGMATDASQQNKDGTNPVVTDNAKVNASQPLIPKSAILRLISEIIRSYGNCVQLITQYNYQPGQTDLVPDGCSVLAFVLDNLLPSSQTVGDKDCPALSRVFVASISSCSHSPDAQMALVTEVKAALGRALALQEGSVKHQRVQALASIINTMIEACPSPGQLPNQVFKGQQVINNNMIKSLVKKGVLVDLARIPHSLDLSSPFLATTINCVLKPLETLSRSVNSPDKFVSVKKADSGAGGSGAAADQGTGGGAELDQGGTTTQVVTEPPNNVTEDTPGGAMATSDPVEVSEMNVTIEDVTNDPEAQANLEMSSEHHIAEPQSSRQMNSLLSQLLGEAGEDREDQVLTEMTISHSQHPAGEEDNEILIDVEVEGDDDYETHDSQMVSQVLSDEDDDGDERHARDHDDNQDDVSGDDEDYDEAYQEETGDDDEDEEDEEEDEDEDEEDTSDMEGEGDEYQDTDDLVMMEDFASRGGVHRHIILNDTSQIQTYQLPVQLHDTEAGNEAQPSLPPAPSNITSTHPLLMRQGEAHTGRSSHRSSAGGIGVRQRVRPFVPTAHANLGLSTRQPNTPVILQRLLGESTAAEILQLTSSFTSQNPGGIGPTRVLLTGDNIPVIQRPDDDLFEGLFQEPFAESSSSGSGALSCIQSTLARWTEESKVLDGDGVHDLVTVLKPPLIEELVRKRDEAMASRKEERKKAAESAALDEKKKESDGGASASKANVSSSGDPITSTAAVTLTTSEAGTDEQRSTQAELLACAMVEQVFSPLVQSSVVASSLPAATTVSASSPMPIPSIDMSTTPSATLATGQVVSADMIGDLTPSITSQDNRPRSSVISSVNFTPFNPTLSGISMASGPTSSQGDMFTPHIVVGGATPSLPPGQHPPRQITQFSFLNNIGNAQGSPVLQQQQQQHQHQQQANVSGPAMTLADNSSATSSLLSIFPATTSFPGLSDSQPLILSQSGGPPAGGAGVWTPQTPIGIADGTQSQPQTAVTSSGQHGSMIIQLLDSIISDHILHPRHSEHATSGSTSSPGSLPPSQTATPVSSAIPLSLPQAPMPVRHIPWQPGAQITIPQRQLYVHHPHTLPTSSEPVRVLGNNLGTEVGMIPQQPQQSQPQLQPQQPQPSLVPLSVATSSNTHNQELFNFASMPVIQPPLIPATSASRAPPATQQFHGLDLAQDLSSIFPSAQQPFYGISGSGVTGATPPLSNLNFVTTTAASSAPIPTPISRDVGSSATSTTYSTTVTASSVPSSHPAEGSSGSVSTTGANNVAGPDVTPGATASQDSTGTLGDTEIPEGVDPSFLAALPEHIRQEVILEQLRLQRIRRRAQEQSSSTNPGNTSGSQPAGESTNSANDPQTMEVNPEFLAALPLAIQEEVLAQQRAEQARAQAAQQSAANPDLPVDPATFFSTLSTSLRQQVLADMDDSMLAVLPPELAAEAQELRRDMEERHRRILQERLFAQAGAASLSTILRHSGLANRLGNRYALRATRRNQWLSGGSRLNPGVQGGALGQSGKVKGRFMLDAEALTCLLVLLFIDEPKLNMSRLHRVLRNLCYHGPTRAWLIRALLSIVQRSGDSNSSSPAATVAANSLCIEGASGTATPPASGFKDKGKGKKSALSSTYVLSSSATTSFSSSSATSVDSVVSMQSLEVGTGGSSHPQHVLHQSSSSAAGGYWLSISLEAALGCRANVFQIYRASGGKRHASSSASATGSINIHPQAAPVVCRHAFDTLISLANVFPTYFLPAGKAKEVSRCEGGVSGAGGKEDELTDTAGRSNSSGTGNTGPQSSPKSLRPAEGASAVKHELRPENDFWNILLRLDSASGKSKGKGVQRCHSSSSSECEHLATDYGSSALGQLMLMLKHPVVRRSQLLTDRLLRLLRHISDRLPDITGRALATSAVSAATGVVSVQEVRRRLTAPPPVAPLVAAPAVTSVAAPVTTASSVASSQGSLQTNDQASHPTEGGTSTKETKKEETSTEAESDEDENPILYEQLKLAVEVLTSKSCSEEGLEDATRLLLQLSGANSATRAAVLELLLSGARQLGLAVCSHIQSLLEQLKELNARLCVDQVDEESSGESVNATGPIGLTSSGQTGKGMLQDRFSSGASVVVSAPTKLKTGRELQLPSMSQLTSKTSGQQFFLRILKVILQLRDAARSAGVKNKKSPSIRSRGRPGFEHIHAILNSVVSEDELLNFLGDNQLEQREIPIYHPQQQNQQHQPLQSSTSGNTQGGLLGMSVSTTTNQSSSTETPVGEAAGSQSQASQSSTTSSEAPMEVDSQAAADDKDKKGEETVAPPSSSSAQARLPRLSEQLGLEQLWSMLGDCLAELARTPDHHAVLILQPAVEAFFIVHAGEKDKKSGEQQQTIIKREDQLAHLNMEMAPPSPSPGPSTALDPLNSGITMASITHLPPDTQKFLKFAETHRTVLNQILRQRTLPLAEGPFSVLVDYTRILDFDVKRRYFRQELERLNEGTRREDLPVHVRRSNVFEDSFRELFRRTPEEWKQRFYIVFEGEEGQDAGGLLREWYIIISHEIFNQNYALFLTSPGDRVTYSINPSSHCNSNHLSYFKFVGRIIAKAVYDNKLLDCYFTRSFYKHMLGLAVKYTDMESEDYAFYQGLVFLLENSVEDLGYDIYFSTEIQEFGVTETRELVPNGSNVLVTDDNKREYVKLVCQMKMTGAIRQQLNAFLEGFYDIIPKKLVSIFTEQELELLISGLPTIDIDELKTNTEYHKYQATSLQIQWFWRALRSFDQAERANFLQFVTGTSKVPLGGFGNLEGMNGTQKFQIHRDDRSTDRLPSAHTCFNQLDLPAYETYDKLRKMLLLAISECSEGFGLA